MSEPTADPESIAGEIQRLRNAWPTWDQRDFYDPQEMLDGLWERLLFVPGIVPPRCPRLPAVDFVDRLRGKAEAEIQAQWREFHDALTVAQRAIADAVNGESAGATQTTTGQGKGNAAAKHHQERRRSRDEVDACMRNQIRKDNSSLEWTQRQWASFCKCSTGTIGNTLLWKELQELSEEAKERLSKESREDKADNVGRA